MEYFKELSENPKIKSYFKSLLGLTIDTASGKLGYWWMLTDCHVNCNVGWYIFCRSAGGRIELHTKDNIVVSENHNGMAMLYANRDIKTYEL